MTTKTMPAVHRCLPRCFRQIPAALIGGFLLAGLSGHAQAEDISRQAQQLKTKYAAAIEDLAAWCDKQGMTAEAKTTRAALGPHDPYKLYVPVLPREFGPPKLPDGASDNVVQWNQKFIQLRHDQAAALIELARKAIGQRHASLAYELTLDAIRHNPDNVDARRLFGYQKYHNGWYTLYEVKKLRVGQVWDDQFGWIPKSDLPRYRHGERRADGRWIGAEEDAKLHRDIRNGWQLETEHYVICTNESVAVGVALGVKLETLYRLWQQIFIRYYATDAYVASLLGSRSAQARSPESHQFEVVYFRDRDDYNRALRVAFPDVGMSTGLYLGEKRTAYFFAGKDSDQRTIYHEATHQLFDLSRHISPDRGAKANFWIIEGIAMYMESLHQEDGYYVLGGLDDARMNTARTHLFKQDFFVPLAELVKYGRERLQSDPKIAMLYSQSAGMANFLFFYGDGRYRDALVSYLSDIYSGHDDSDTLAKLTGCGYAELDKQYRQFMRVDELSDPSKQPSGN
jgi:hypothetical protein